MFNKGIFIAISIIALLTGCTINSASNINNNGANNSDSIVTKRNIGNPNKVESYQTYLAGDYFVGRISVGYEDENNIYSESVVDEDYVYVLKHVQKANALYSQRVDIIQINKKNSKRKIIYSIEDNNDNVWINELGISKYGPVWMARKGDKFKIFLYREETNSCENLLSSEEEKLLDCDGKYVLLTSLTGERKIQLLDLETLRLSNIIDDFCPLSEYERPHFQNGIVTYQSKDSIIEYSVSSNKKIEELEKLNKTSCILPKSADSFVSWLEENEYNTDLIIYNLNDKKAKRFNLNERIEKFFAYYLIDNRIILQSEDGLFEFNELTGKLEKIIMVEGKANILSYGKKGDNGRLVISMLDDKGLYSIFEVSNCD